MDQPFLYEPFKDESKPLQIKIPWDKNTARGFAAALIIAALFLIFSPVINIGPPKAKTIESNLIPIEIMNFGEGDGTGQSKGNLSEEGKAHQGKSPLSDMHDAEVSANTKFNNKSQTGDPENATSFAPQDKLSSNEKNNKTDLGSGTKNVGSKDGSASGTGLGDKGSGPGLGQGIGPIDWGGGGNRTVLYKKLPEYPKGVNNSAEIKIRFTVSKDGTVINTVPLQKGDPDLERAAINALKQWRFNPLKEEKIMYGIITFTFKLN